jgi:hypothetical protein
MRKTLTTATLVLALSCHAWAGIIHIPPVAPEPEPTPTNAAQETATTDEDAGATNTLTQIVLTALVSILP